MCAGRFTIADISVGFALMMAEFLGLNAKFSPAVAAYWQALQQREGYRRAAAKQDSDPGVKSVRESLQQR
jgi:glutathione S-transferase